MVWRMLQYEGKRSLPLVAAWAAGAVVPAVFARLRIFSLTDMPLFYLMLFSSIGLMLYRYYASMHGPEAAFLFTIDLSPGKQMFVRYFSAGCRSIVTALMIGLALSIQGEELGSTLRNLSLPMRMLLLGETAFSAFALFLTISAPLTISNIRPFSKHPVLWFLIIGAVMMGANRLLPKITERLLPVWLVITGEGNVLVSTVPNMAGSLSFSFNVLLWNVVLAAVVMFGVPAVIRKKLLIAR